MVLSVFAGTVAFAGAGAAQSTFEYEGGAVHYVDSSDDAVIEVPFSAQVNSNSLTTDNFTVFDDDEDISGQVSSITQPQNGRVIVEMNDVVQSRDIEIRLSGDIQDASNNDLSNGGRKDVAFAATTVGPNGDVNAYRGSVVAVVASSVNTDIEITDDDDDFTYFVSGSTGTNSRVYTFDTENRDVGSYEATFDGSNTATIELRELGLDVDIDDRTVTDEDEIEGTVSANAGTRGVQVELLDSDGDAVSGESVTGNLDGQGEFEFTLGPVDTDDYTVEVTDLGSGVVIESDVVTVSKAGEGRADIAGGIVTQQRGDIANITVTLSNTDTATLTIGSEDAGFRANVTVEDDSGDGQVNVLFNTYAATNGVSGDVFDVADSDDDIDTSDIDPQNRVSSLLDAGEYDLEVRSGDDASDDSQGVGTLVLEERTTDSLVSWTAPTGTTFDDSDEVYEAVANANVTESDDIADGDLVIHQLQASGLEGALEAQSGNDTAAFFALNGNVYELSVEESNPSANRDAFVLNLHAGNTVVVPDPDNDTYFVAFDTDDVVGERPNGQTVQLDDGQELLANFTVYEDEGNLADEDQTVEDEYGIVEAEHSLDEPVNVSAASGQTVAGETTVAPGTELSLRVRSSGDTQPSFLKTASVYVTEDGTYEGTFDFSEQQAGDTFEVTVRGGAADSLTVDGNVGEGDATTDTATDTVTETPTDTETQTETEIPTDGEPTDTATEAPTDGEPTDTATETSTGTPGFGVVVALVALLAAALLAVRRD
ncbi:PGF-CTERM protein [Halogeometricum rufum]|uniref:PGF-CTERM protein n=2 Tax=Halogeometricum rufum TaxID=553469 RepID=A0A1I6J741_9EURY|nr:PGF-CTERM protein [Halogeometricum rufum]